MLKGPSGCGKTLLAKLNQAFYGDFKTLSSWSSTVTAISVAGNAYKDVLFVVDDFKEQNFITEYKKKEVMTLLQNYGDQNSRGRSNIGLTLRDEKSINGFLLISAEDLVITEASTVARAIIINMENKKPNFEGVNQLKNISNNFKKFTPYYIKYLLQKNTVMNLGKIFELNTGDFNSIVKKMQLEGNNIARIVNNFALLKTSWDILRLFLFTNSDKETHYNYDFLFTESLKLLFMENYERVQTQNPEIKFEETLWDLIENKILVMNDAGGKLSNHQRNR